MQQSPGVLNLKLKFTPINRISPSRYEALKCCALREVWSANKLPKLLPVHTVARLGTVIHSLLEEASSKKFSINDCQVLEKRWEELIAEIEADMRNSWLEQHLVPLNKSIRDYEVRRICAIKCAQEFFKLSSLNLKNAQSNLSIEGHEFWVESRNGLVGGFIDCIANSDEGPIIRDYKSGSIFDESTGGVKSSYETQLKLYAALFREKTGKWPAKIEIIPLQGAPVHVEFDPKECTQLLEDAICSLSKVNKLIEFLKPKPKELEERLANPSATNCRHCLFRPACKAYLRCQKLIGENPEWPKDVIGILEEIRCLGNSKIVMFIQTDANSDSKICVRGLHPAARRHPAISHLDKGDRIGLFNLYSRDTALSFTESQTTTIYKIVEAPAYGS